MGAILKQNPRFHAGMTSPLGDMVSQQYDLGDVQQALDDMHTGKLNRGVLSLC